MREKWLQRYRESAGLGRKKAEVLLGFNANIDRIVSLENSELKIEDVRPRKHERVSTITEMKQELRDCVESGESREVDVEGINISGGETRAGGQPAIMANYLASLEDKPIFYTPELSEVLAGEIKSGVKVPSAEGEQLELLDVEEAADSDRTKENLIVEYEEGTGGRVIFSSSLRGFGPYFDSELEPHLEELDDEVDCCVLSGFHDAEGNVEARLEKSRKQLQSMESPIHLEYVHRNRYYAEKIFEEIVSEVDSLGLDEGEGRALADSLDIVDEITEFNLGEAFKLAKEMIHRYRLERVHIHTTDYHLCATERDYLAPEKIRRAMLYGDLCGFRACSSGQISGQEDLEAGISRSSIQGLEELNDFGDYFGIEEFAAEGIARLKGLNVVAIPPLIDESPERMVGIGDIISCGAFTGEAKLR
ncbi:MAG: ADP-dependent glucokinase/phosphofructokinase [Candidatus Nanohaloarchaea archaeon]